MLLSGKEKNPTFDKKGRGGGGSQIHVGVAGPGVVQDDSSREKRGTKIGLERELYRNIKGVISHGKREEKKLTRSERGERKPSGHYILAEEW